MKRHSVGMPQKMPHALEIWLTRHFWWRCLRVIIISECFYFCFNRSKHESTEQIASHNFLMNSGTLRIRAPAPTRRVLATASRWKFLSARANIEMAELDWFFWRHVPSFAVFVCARDIILERDFYIFPFRPRALRANPTVLSYDTEARSCSDQSQTLFPIFARPLLKGSVVFAVFSSLLGLKSAKCAKFRVSPRESKSLQKKQTSCARFQCAKLSNYQRATRPIMPGQTSAQVVK